MTKELLKEILEGYWYDNQYLKEKAKEVEKMNSYIKEGNQSDILISTKKYEESQMLSIIEKKKNIESLIQSLSQPYKTIMYMKYISFMTFDEIASKMNYSTKRIYQLHSEGFSRLLDIVSSNSFNL